jgi:hypothetical protein
MIELPQRAGPRPRTSAGIPHRQLDQNPAPSLYAMVAARWSALPDAVYGPSGISVPGARALFLPPCPACNERYGFMHGREFAHLHPPEDGSFHMVLAPDDLQSVLARGWGELHPWVPSGRVLPNVAMVFAPRDAHEAQVVLQIAAASMRNASCVQLPPMKGPST